jgi:hypothetical protein
VIEEADELYGGDIGDFVARRDALAKRLRADGRREDATAVKQLRKPPAVVWEANQLLRSDQKAARALASAAERAAAKPADRSALSAFRDALDAFDADERVRPVLQAAALDPQVREALVAGRLTEEPAPTGFGAITGVPTPARRSKAAPKKREPAPEPQPSPAARKRVERAQARVEQARERLAAAEQELAEALGALKIQP